MSKRCVNCGAELPEGAAFCPHCESVQSPKREVSPPRPRRRRPLICAACALAAAAAVGILALRGTGAPAVSETPPAVSESAPAAIESAPRASSNTSDDGSGLAGVPAETLYTGEDGVSYRLVLSFDGTSAPDVAPVPERENLVPPGRSYANPSQLYVRTPDGADGQEAFSALVASAEVQALPRGGAEAMDFTEPVHDPSFPYAAMTSHIGFRAGCGVNDILWTLTMKNGDVIRLRQTVSAVEQEVVTFTPEDTPMDTLAQVQALLDRVGDELPFETAVDIYLPPVAYEGGLTLPATRGLSLYGSAEGEARTSFSGTIEVNSAYMQLTNLSGIDLLGSGGVGVRAVDGVHLYECRLSGWDTAALALDGSWLGADSCVFENNGVALHFDTDYSMHYSSPGYQHNSFIDNGTAVLIENLPGNEVLDFSTSRFSGNGEDMVNPAAHPVDMG